MQQDPPFGGSVMCFQLLTNCDLLLLQRSCIVIATIRTRLGSRAETNEKPLHENVQNWNEEQVQYGGKDHAAYDCRTDRVTTEGTSTRSEIQRQHTKNKG